jgi:hypothetical protein
VNARDKDAIAVLEAKIHRVEGKRACRCEDCRAIRRVCLLAREAIDDRDKRTKAIGRAVKSTIRAMDAGRVPNYYISQAAVRGEARR